MSKLDEYTDITAHVPPLQNRFLESKKNSAECFRSQFFAKYLHIMKPEANKVKRAIQTGTNVFQAISTSPLTL